MTRNVYLLCIDTYHLGDSHFLELLARNLTNASQAKRPCVIVHGGGEKVERTLESEGIFPERVEGVLQVDDPSHVRLIERAVREANQELVNTLTDEVVSAVGLQGVDRHLLKLQDGNPVAGRVGWVEDLVKMQIVPVISSLVYDPEIERVREVATVKAAESIGRGMGDFDPTLVVFSKNGESGIQKGDSPEKPESTVRLGELPEDALSDEVISQLETTSTRTLLTSIDGFFDENGPIGTYIEQPANKMTA